MYHNNAVVRPKRKAVTDAMLNAIEKRLGFKFPKQIREHYRYANGGSLKKYVFPKENGSYIVSELFPVGNYDDSLESHYEDFNVEQKLVPKHLVAFANDPGGDFFCFSVKPGDEGAIYVYRHEYYDDLPRAVKRVAGSLREFVEGMQPDES